MPDQPNTDTPVQDFANLSAALTGFQPGFLRPFLDPTNLAGTFLAFVVSQAGQPMVDALLTAFRHSDPGPTDSCRHSAGDREHDPLESGAALSGHCGDVVLRL